MFIRGETGWYAARHCSRVPLELHCSENKPLQPARTYFPCEILVGAVNEYSIIMLQNAWLKKAQSSFELSAAE